MTDRGLPIVDGAPACPFVAFEDDRDGRAQAPDHRHRCFADPRPAPRALAHQEAYCLSSAFPVCPTFQDWARREAAIARSSASAEPPAREEPAVNKPMPPRDREPRHAPGTETPPPIPPRRPQARDWAAPPPWTDDAHALDGPAVAGAAAVGAAAAAVAGSTPGVPGAAGSVDGDVPPPAFLQPRASAHPEDWGSASRGLAGSAADRLAGPADIGEEAGWDVSPAAPPTPTGSSSRVPVAGREAQRPAAPPPPRRSASRRRPDDEAAELFGPAWEQPHRYEAYPTLRTRVGLPDISGAWIAVVALLLAGGGLFFVGPMLLGIGGEEAARATASPSTLASAVPSPTLAPAPTPQIYVIVKNDTLNKIAKRHGITLEALMAANPQIKNPNKIKVGDQITIPVPAEVPGEVEEPASS